MFKAQNFNQTVEDWLFNWKKNQELQMQSVQIFKIINDFSYFIYILTLSIYLHMYNFSLSLPLCMTTIETLFCEIGFNQNSCGRQVLQTQVWINHSL